MIGACERASNAYEQALSLSLENGVAYNDRADVLGEHAPPAVPSLSAEDSWRLPDIAHQAAIHAAEDPAEALPAAA